MLGEDVWQGLGTEVYIDNANLMEAVMITPDRQTHLYILVCTYQEQGHGLIITDRVYVRSGTACRDTAQRNKGVCNRCTVREAEGIGECVGGM